MAIEYEITPLSWENKGTEPPDTLKQSGWQPAQKPASAYFNYEWALVNDCLKELQAKLSDHATLNDQEIAKKLDSSEFTADKIIEVLNEASGSSGGGLNADTLDGKDSAAFAEAAHTHSEFESMVRVEGLEDAPSTGLLIDSDLLEGHQASYFATAASMESAETAINNLENRVTPISLGGTGATTAAEALSNLGAAAASHDHSATNITSGTLAIARGGTGATSASNARSNLGVTGTVLYNNTSGTYGTVTLAYSAANYDYLVIYFMNYESLYGSTKIYSPNGKTAVLELGAPPANGTEWYYRGTQIVISGEILTFKNPMQAWIKGPNDCDSLDLGSAICIKRVEGWNI